MALNLTEAMAVVAIQKKLPFTTYKTLCEWLGCYNFIPRSQRQLSPILANRLLSPIKVIRINEPHTANEIFQAWLIADMLEVTLTSAEQTKVAIWMNDSKL